MKEKETNQLVDCVMNMPYEQMAEFLNELAARFHNTYAEELQKSGETELFRCFLWAFYGVHKASYGIERAVKAIAKHNQ